MTTRYDDALPAFAEIIANSLGEAALIQNYILRDASGKLTFVVLTEIDEDQKASIALEASVLTPYVDLAAGVIATPDELLDPSLEQENIGVLENVFNTRFSAFVRVVERRIVGQDWLERPKQPIADAPPVVVFASHKGGVGRSTALAVASIAFANRGLDTLIIDLDLEAPGVGDIFLSRENEPKFGTLDYFVETTFGPVDDDFMENMIAISSLSMGRGRIHICPAVGSAANQNPQNVIGKISRSYLESNEDVPSSFLQRTRQLVARLAGINRYDVIFVDARAGLNEATAAAILGLGAQVLLFGIDTPQTFSGYNFFLSYLERFRPSEAEDDDWRANLRMVHAKASVDAKSQSNFRTQTFEVFADTIYDEEDGLDSTSFNFNYDDASAPHFAWPILDDSNYSEFKPLQKPEQFSSEFYERTFGSFINSLLESVELSEINGQQPSET